MGVLAERIGAIFTTRSMGNKLDSQDCGVIAGYSNDEIRYIKDLARQVRGSHRPTDTTRVYYLGPDDGRCGSDRIDPCLLGPETRQRKAMTKADGIGTLRLRRVGDPE